MTPRSRPPPRNVRPSRIGVFWRAGTSREWAGVAALAFYVQLLIALLSIAQLSLGSFIASSWQMYEAASEECVTTGLKKRASTMWKPYTVWALGEGSESGWVGSFGRVGGFGLLLWPTMLLPLFTLTLTVILVFRHIRSAGIMLRDGLVWGCMTLLHMPMYVTDFNSLHVDYRTLQEDWPICFVFDDRAHELRLKIVKRRECLAARAWMIVVTAILMSLYVTLTFIAMFRAAREERAQAQRQAAVHRLTVFRREEQSNTYTGTWPSAPAPTLSRNHSQPNTNIQNNPHHHTAATNTEETEGREWGAMMRAQDTFSDPERPGSVSVVERENDIEDLERPVSPRNMI